MTPERTIARRLEIVHESLLTKWPRLLRWRTQDAEGAQLRDELRQAARTWHEHGRSDDLLWTGSAYREFQVWRERYPGRLTEVEEAFAAAMAALAGRLKRRRRLAVAAILSTLVVGLGVVGSFWRHSVLEARRAEAAKLLALGQLAIEASPSAAVAYAIASLELADTTESRLLALKALWRGPTAFVVTEDGSRSPRFSPDGRWAAYGAWSPELEVRMLRADGSTRVLEQPYEESMHLWDIGPGSDVLLTAARSFPSPRLLELRSAPEGRHLAELRYQDRSWLGGVSWNDERLLVLISENGEGHVDALSFNGSQERLGGLGFDFRPDENGHSPAVVAMDRRTGRWLGAVVENEVQVFEVGEHDLSKPRRLGRQEGPEIRLAFDPLGRYLATANQLGQIRLWDPKGTSPPTILEGPPGLEYLAAYGDGGLLVAAFLEDEHRKVWVWSVAGGKPTLLRRFDLGRQAPAAWWTIDPVGAHLARVDWDKRIRLWPFGAPADAEPILLGRDEQGQIWAPSFHPQGHWLATASGSGVALYPLSRTYASVLRHSVQRVSQVAFAPDGSWLASCANFGSVRIWPLDGEVPSAGRTLYQGGPSAPPSTAQPMRVAISSDGEQVLVSTTNGGEKGNLLLSLDGSTRLVLRGFRHYTSAVVFSRDGRFAAGAGGMFVEEENLIRVWDVASGAELRVLVPEADLYDEDLEFTTDDRLLSSGLDGLRRWNLETGASELLYAGSIGQFSAGADGRRALLVEVAEERWAEGAGRALLVELESGVATPLRTHGSRVTQVALDPTGTLAATGGEDGVIRVGPVSGEEPHLLLGHESGVLSLAFDPRGRAIASGASDGTARLWPMPDLAEPPLHTLPRDELIAKLKSLTNLRVVRDPHASTGWKVALDPFPGWETVPTW